MAKKKLINRNTTSGRTVTRPKAVYAGKVIRNKRTQNAGSLGQNRSSNSIGRCKNCG